MESNLQQLIAEWNARARETTNKAYMECAQELQGVMEAQKEDPTLTCCENKREGRAYHCKGGANCGHIFLTRPHPPT